MRAALILAEADAAAFASGADVVIAERARAPGPGLYLREGFFSDFAPAGVALAAAGGGADVQRLGARLAVEEARRGWPDGALRILAFAAATPRAAATLDSFCGASARLAGLVFSPAPTLRGGPLRLTRDLTVLAARAAGVAALDAAFPDLGDVQGLEAAAQAARDDGFDGMAALSAAQVAVILRVFSP